ncbi:hypothetical protein BCR43DRAFT_468312 [Syncephalastrum racemosum]|uniref:Uncharacterized protein n=1 Tax=Syncephalastrum racemosum TaxID=13706 RepID=A0A1X2HN22_SYNRA|nr:hypothetical protein BCR43DRAFT_468312 [Syncephalastrum racemosum]
MLSDHRLDATVDLPTLRPIHKQLLSKRSYVEMTIDIAGTLNADWVVFPQYRFVCTQFLAGAIVVNNKDEAVMINCAEIYGRRSTVGHGHLTSPSSTSLPQSNTKYPNAWMTIKTDSDGSKLVLGTKSWNVLVTSSMRIDAIRPPCCRGYHV